METPLIVRYPGQEPNLAPIGLSVRNEKNKKFAAYLHTSPEYTMKKMLAAGWDKIFYLGKCFRDQESFGGTHNPEFTMIEWYRTNADMFNLMSDIEKMFKYICGRAKFCAQSSRQNGMKVERISMRELWQKHVGVDLDDYLDEKTMLKLCHERGYKAKAAESYEELFYRIFLNEIEPKLGANYPLIVYNYPAKMASLAKLTADKKYAERFELYYKGLELANAFSELTDAREQEKRLKREKSERERTGKNVFDIDQDFIDALKSGLPRSAGIALGFDRLVMALAACQEIDDVIVLPMSKLFK